MNLRREIIKQIIDIEKEIEKCDEERRKLGKQAAQRAKVDVEGILTSVNYTQIEENLEKAKRLEIKRDNLWKEFINLLKQSIQ